MNEIRSCADDSRAELALFAKACGSRAQPMKDEYGDRHLLGRFGRIYVTGIGEQQFNFIVGAEIDGELTRQEWTYAKKALRFCRLTQDGDTEGAFVLDRLPSAGEGEMIRQYLGLPKRREQSDAEVERLLALTQRYGFKAKKAALETAA